MSLLVRKIDKSKWLQTDIYRGEDISADAITNCLRTNRNTLSVWEVDSESNIDEAVLTIVSGHQHLETIDVVPMDAEYLKENEIDCIRTDGLTPIDNLIKTHIDLACLSYRKLGIIAYHIADNITKQMIIRYTKVRLKEILNRAIREGRLKLEDLSDLLKKKLEN
jgi:hypothetical protein